MSYGTRRLKFVILFTKISIECYIIQFSSWNISYFHNRLISMANLKKFNLSINNFKLTNCHQISHWGDGSVGLEFVSLGLRRDCGESSEAFSMSPDVYDYDVYD